MPMWRCPHCGTPQAETARCWVCRRSSTACLTCRHFRRSVAGTLGYCALDARRAPLHGDEIRSCWETTPLPYAPTIGFLEVPSVRSDPGHPRTGGPAAPLTPSDGESGESRWSLFDD
jgi:hypothetical protein